MSEDRETYWVEQLVQARQERDEFREALHRAADTIRDLGKEFEQERAADGEAMAFAVEHIRQYCDCPDTTTGEPCKAERWLRSRLKEGEACPHGDKTCPCQDGDACHYEKLEGEA